MNSKTSLKFLFLWNAQKPAEAPAEAPEEPLTETDRSTAKENVPRPGPDQAQTRRGADPVSISF